jgi:MinD-like ATPase involved in chromosome partitioning or flagellar assembly
VSWRRQVKVVTGGQGPGQRNQGTPDRDRIRQPLDGPRRIAVLGCTRGAGQTITTLMIGHILANVRAEAVAALDLNPGATSLSARRAPALSIRALLSGQPAPGSGPRLDVISDQPQAAPGLTSAASDQADQASRADQTDQADRTQPPGPAPRSLEPADLPQLAELLSARYPLTLIDPSPSGLMQMLSAVDQLVLVAPASPDAATALANTQQWLGAHGFGDLAGRAVTVINGVSKRTSQDVLRAESVARGRCRAIVRVPWDDLLSARSGSQSSLQPQTRLAYTALAGVVVTGLTANGGPERNPGEHSD